MARLPSQYDLSQPTSGRSGRVIAQMDNSGFARGVQQLGAGIANLGAGISAANQDMQREQSITETIGADGPATKERHDFLRTFDQDGDYSTFDKRASKGLGEIKSKYASKISDPKARMLWEADFDKAAESDRNRIADLGAIKMREGKLVEAKSGLQSYQSIIADDSVEQTERDRAKQNAEASIDVLQKQGLLDPSEADAWREDVIKGGEFVYGQRQIEKNGAAALGNSNVVDKIIGVESGGKVDAKNPNSSATGLGQFISSTWLKMIKTYRPDVAAGKSSSEVLALRNDPNLSREMTERYTQENAAYLKNQGIPTTDGNVYLAHFLGPGGASRALKADPSANVADVIGQDAVNANPFLKGKTIAELQAWSDKKMGGAGRPSWYTSQSPEKQLQFDKQAKSEEERRANEGVAQQKAVQVQTNDDYRLRIATRDPSLTQQQIMDDIRIDNGDKATLIDSFTAKTKDDAAVNMAMPDFAAGKLSINPYSTEGKKVVDGIEEQIMKGLPAEQHQSVTEELVRQSGIVPQKTFNGIRAGLDSTDIGKVEAAAQAAARISQINPVALSRRDGGAGVQQRADDFNYFVNTLNLSPTEAAQKIAEMNNPDKQRERKALEPAAKAFQKQIEGEDIASMFDDSWLPGNDPQVGFTEGQALGIQAEYQAIAEEQFFRSNGNPDIAKARAQAEMKRLYGVTELTGKAVVMKHPPERYWPANTAVPGGILGAGDPLGYIKDQLRNEIRTADPEFDDSSIQFVTTPATDAMIKRGEMPGYAVFYADKNGVLQTFPGKLWRPDVASAKSDVAAQQQKAVDDAKAADQFQRERVIPGQDRDATLNNFLDGDPLTGQPMDGGQ